VHYHPYVEHSYSQDYFTLEAIDNCTFSFNCPNGGISLSTDGGETWSLTTGETAITVSSGTKTLCKGNMEMGDGPFLTSNGRYNIEGNIFSLYYGDNFTGNTSLEDN
jgi:hypothetical protein